MNVADAPSATRCSLGSLPHTRISERGSTASSACRSAGSSRGRSWRRPQTGTTTDSTVVRSVSFTCSLPWRRRPRARRACRTGPHDSVRRMILVVDHYDSFTYNLVQLIEGLGHATQVVKSDERPAEQLVAM